MRKVPQEGSEPRKPKMRGSHENGATCSSGTARFANSVYKRLPAVAEKYMAKINAKAGHQPRICSTTTAADADQASWLCGSICDVADEVIDYLNAKGEKVGIIAVRLYCPWVSSALLKVLPKTAKKVAVLGPHHESPPSGRAPGTWMLSHYSRV